MPYLCSVVLFISTLFSQTSPDMDIFVQRGLKITHSVLFSLSSVQFSSVAQSCPTLCDPMNRSTPGLPVHHHLLEFIQTQVHRVSDTIQPSLPLSSPYPPAPNPSQHQGLLNESVLPLRWPQYWSFSFSISPSNEYSRLISLGWTGWISLQSKGL